MAFTLTDTGTIILISLGICAAALIWAVLSRKDMPGSEDIDDDTKAI